MLGRTVKRNLGATTLVAGLLVVLSGCDSAARERLDTGGLSVGDEAGTADDPYPWVGEDGTPDVSRVPAYYPVCGNPCDTIIGFTPSVSLFPIELADLSDQRVVAEMLENPPLEVVDEYGVVVGYWPPEQPFMTVEEYAKFEARTASG